MAGKDTWFRSSVQQAETCRKSQNGSLSLFLQPSVGISVEKILTHTHTPLRCQEDRKKHKE